MTCLIILTTQFFREETFQREIMCGLLNAQEGDFLLWNIERTITKIYIPVLLDSCMGDKGNQIWVLWEGLDSPGFLLNWIRRFEEVPRTSSYSLSLHIFEKYAESISKNYKKICLHQQIVSSEFKLPMSNQVMLF